MRLTCPNCSARYEVDDSMVPPEGRDVQCSNCATTWFQPGRRVDRQPSRRPDAVRVQRPPQPTPPAAPPTAAPAPTPPPAPTPAPEPEPTPAPAVSAPEDQATPPRAKQTLDPSVRDILRQEAEREARLRRSTPDPVESQAEMTLEEADPSVERAVRTQIAEATSATLDAHDLGPVARRDLLPDIEELNSTLRDTGDRSADEDSTTDIDALDYGPRRRRGVRLGFLLMLLIFAGLAMIYTNSDALSAQLPALSGVLEGFAAGVDAIRLWLDGLAQGLAGAEEEIGG